MSLFKPYKKFFKSVKPVQKTDLEPVTSIFSIPLNFYKNYNNNNCKNRFYQFAYSPLMETSARLTLSLLAFPNKRLLTPKNNRSTKHRRKRHFFDRSPQKDYCRRLISPSSTSLNTNRILHTVLLSYVIKQRARSAHL